jgi:hypothetical protein
MFQQSPHVLALPFLLLDLRNILFQALRNYCAFACEIAVRVPLEEIGELSVHLAGYANAYLRHVATLTDCRIYNIF